MSSLLAEVLESELHKIHKDTETLGTHGLQCHRWYQLVAIRLADRLRSEGFLDKGDYRYVTL